MFVTHLKLRNWRNFRNVDVDIHERTYLLGANASGKSNLLDVFRFLKDVSKPQGGGLQKAVADRGGIQKLRCLHARKDPEVRIEIVVSESPDSDSETWRYVLGFKPEGKGAQRTLISKEQVWSGDKLLIDRPSAEDLADSIRLSQTSIEQIQVNGAFRDLAVFLGEITYLHLVPQLLKYGDKIGGHRIEDDPYGQGFLERVARATKASRDSRLKKISKALAIAVPQFGELRFVTDEVTGRPHLEAMYAHYRPNAGWQREEQFSDGTLRLLALLWVLLESDSLLLLEEPELSLNDSIVREIPRLLERVQKDKKRRRRQIFISTHSEALLSNPGIDARGVLLLEPALEGTKVRPINEQEKISLLHGFSVAEVVLPKTHPLEVEQLGFWE